MCVSVSFSLFRSVIFIDRVHVLEDRSLVLENVNLSDEGEYRCEAENVVGSISAVGSLIIQCTYLIKMKLPFFHFDCVCVFVKRYVIFNFYPIAAPKFVIRPTAQSVDIQSDASFECQVSVKTIHTRATDSL